MQKRNLELDRLRAFAVIMTIGIHYARVFFPWAISKDYHAGTTILNILKNSWTGVDLFFVISGYIISKTIVNQIDSLKNSTGGLIQFVKGFYLRRIYRIYPVAWVTFLIVLFCSFIFNSTGEFGTPVNNIEAGISIFTYTFNYYFAYGNYHALTLSPYWSLSVEEQFYLLLPMFIIFTSTTKQRVIILLAVLAIITFIIRPYFDDGNLFLTQTRCDGLIYGCLIYFLSQQSWFSGIILGHNKKYINMIITIILILILSSITAIGFSNKIVIPIGCLISSILVALAAQEKKIIISIPYLQGSLDYIGSRSYSLYIAHFPMFTLTQEIMYRMSKIYSFEINSNLAIYYTVIAILLALLSGELLHRFIETPLMKKGKVISKQFIETSTLTN